MSKQWVETLYDAYGQSYTVDRVHFEMKTDHQHLMIFDNAMHGRVMVLDGIVQTTQGDEFIYHEMLTHVPILAHGAIESVLIIGGGDGGILREVCKHQSIKTIVQVEIDQAVIDMATEYLPAHSDGAFDDPRATIVIGDGCEYVKNCGQQFDLIITDSTDPIGPGEVLFTQSFYADCQKCLNDDGILVTQNGVPYYQPDEMLSSAQKFHALFADWAFYGAAVPTYVGGIMAFGWAANSPRARHTDLTTIQSRFEAAAITTAYYNPAIHLASFALPQYLLDKLNGLDLT